MEIADNNHWSYYFAWGLLGPLGIFITLFPMAALSIPIMNRILGDMVLIRGELRITEDYLWAYAFLPFLGITIGILQFLLLRHRLSKMGGWILTATIGWSLLWLGFALKSSPIDKIELPSSTVYSLFAGAVLGTLIGVMQWLLLRGKLAHASWWIPANLLGFGIAGVIFWNANSFFGIVVAIAAPCFVTGVVLWILFNQLYPSSSMNSSLPASLA